MRFTLASLAVLALVSAAPQDSASAITSIGSATGSATAALSTASSSIANTSTTSGPVTHTVAVAKGGHTFVPDVTLAEAGDFIEFQFYPTNHSVVRAEYGYPCVPYEMVAGVNSVGFFSGFKPVDAVLPEPPTYTIELNDTAPIFFYCSQINSCIGYGMVGVINPNASTSLEHQRQLAESSTFMLNPGEDWPNEGSIPSGVSTTSSSATATATAAETTSATAAATAATSHSVLSTGAIAGIAIGGAAVLLAAGIAIWFCGRQSRLQKTPQPPAPTNVTHQTDPNSPMAAYFSPTSTAHMSQVSQVYPKHVSMVSGYNVPPGYGIPPSQSPPIPQYHQHTPVDPLLAGHEIGQMQASSPSPSQGYVNPAPAYGQPMYTDIGSHRVLQEAAVHEMPGVNQTASPPTSPRRSSITKSGVERYG